MSDILERLRVQARSGLMFLPHDFKVVSYGESADEIARLRTALSETEQRVKDARREALEKAAAIIDANMLCAADDGREVLHPRSNPGNKVGAAYAAAIRALIPSEPHDAEGRE